MFSKQIVAFQSYSREVAQSFKKNEKYDTFFTQLYYRWRDISANFSEEPNKFLKTSPHSAKTACLLLAHLKKCDKNPADPGGCILQSTSGPKLTTENIYTTVQYYYTVHQIAFAM